MSKGRWLPQQLRAKQLVSARKCEKRMRKEQQQVRQEEERQKVEALSSAKFRKLYMICVSFQKNYELSTVIIVIRFITCLGVVNTRGITDIWLAKD